MNRVYPEHIGTGITPTDVNCHSHSSSVQQYFHNLHCRILKCPHALNWTKRHPDVQEHLARNTVEKILGLLG